MYGWRVTCRSRRGQDMILEIAILDVKADETDGKGSVQPSEVGSTSKAYAGLIGATN